MAVTAPYRDAIESVLRRCEDLRARIGLIQGRAVLRHEISTLEEAVAWEAELRAHLDALDERAAEDEPVAPAVRPARADVRTYSALRTTIWFALVLATIVVFVVQFRR